MNGNFQPNLDRADTPAKCSGAARYVRDLRVPNMLEALTVRSTVRRAVITEISIPELPPGYSCVRPEDIPGPNQISYFRDPCPILAPSSVHYLGEPVLLLVGEDMTLLRRLADQVRVRYEEVPAIHTMEEALAGGRPPIFGPDNVYEDETFGHGDVDQIFTQAVEIFETTTRTGYQDHLYLEP